MSKYVSTTYYVIRSFETDDFGVPWYVKRVKLTDGVVKVKPTQRWRKAFFFMDLSEARMAASLVNENSEDKNFEVVEVSVVMQTV